MNGTFNPMNTASTVYGIAGAGISLGLLAGMAKGIQDITYRKEPIVRRKQKTKYNAKQRQPYQPYKPVQIRIPKRYSMRY